MNELTLGQWIEKNPGEILDGLVLDIPEGWRQPSMPKGGLSIRSAWGMTEGRCGVWFGKPGDRTGRVWPVTDIPVEEELYGWKVLSQW